MERKKNDCLTCPYREALHFTHHSKCNIIGSTIPIDATEKALLDVQTSILVSTGVLKNIKSKEDNSVLLSFNSHGVENGWCNWPINFDPIWVDCRFDIGKGKEETQKTEEHGL